MKMLNRNFVPDVLVKIYHAWDNEKLVDVDQRWSEKLPVPEKRHAFFVEPVTDYVQFHINLFFGTAIIAGVVATILKFTGVI